MRPMHLLAVSLVFGVVFGPLSTPALAKKPVAAESPASQPARTASTTETTDAAGLIRQEVDLDGDGRADVVNLLRDRGNGGARLQVKKQTDLNLDGRFDVETDFDETGAMVEERTDSDFDGRFDWTDHYKDGVRVLAELDSDFDGQIDTWSYYLPDESGRSHIDRKERDTNHDGRVDLWERFDSSGNVVRTGRDTDNDGKMDQRDE